MSDEPWTRQVGEPSLWFGRFAHFDQLGTGRSIRQVWIAERQKQSQSVTPGVPRAWGDAARTWDWVRRAQLHDDAITAAASADYEAERLDERLRRINTLKGLRGKALTALNALQVTEMDSFAIIAALKLVTQELRREYNDEPAQRVEHSGTVGGDIVVRYVNDWRAGSEEETPE